MKGTIILPSNLLTAFFLMTLIVFSSCAKDEDTTPDPIEDNPVVLPAEVVTSYQGDLSYTSASGDFIFEENGTATITGSNGTYTISFSNGVPALNALKFKTQSGGYATISDDGSLSGIAIDGDDLDIGSTKDGATWAFSGSKN